MQLISVIVNFFFHTHLFLWNVLALSPKFFIKFLLFLFFHIMISILQFLQCFFTLMTKFTLSWIFSIDHIFLHFFLTLLNAFQLTLIFQLGSLFSLSVHINFLIIQFLQHCLLVVILFVKQLIFLISKTAPQSFAFLLNAFLTILIFLLIFLFFLTVHINFLIVQFLLHCFFIVLQFTQQLIFTIFKFFHHIIQSYSGVLL